MANLNNTSGIGTVLDKWNRLNPFLQNQRVKNLYTQAKTYSKTNINTFLSDPANNEPQLRSLGWANSSSQQIYYNILRRSADIPIYNYYKIPELLDSQAEYNDDSFKFEDRLTDEWLEVFSIPNTFKTIALEVKREGKSSYLLRNKIAGSGKQRRVEFCTLQKLPTDWVKITGRGQLGFTISFNFMYFMNLANDPSFFGEYIKEAWEDMVTRQVFVKDEKLGSYEFNVENAKDYSFTYKNNTYGSIVEHIRGKGKQQEYFMWLKMPYDICYTFGSDNSNP